MLNGDPTVFGLPCCFPAAPSIRPEDRVQGFDQKRLFGVGQAPKNFFPEFPGAAGKGRRRRRQSAECCGDIAAVDVGDVGGGLERHRMVQKGLRHVLGRHLAAEKIACRVPAQ